MRTLIVPSAFTTRCHGRLSLLQRVERVADEARAVGQSRETRMPTRPRGIRETAA